MTTLQQVIACPAFLPLAMFGCIAVAIFVMAALGVGDTRAKPYRRRGR